MSCCPSDSTPFYADDYVCKGKEETIANGTEIYTVGNESSNSKAIILIPDIWGWDGGRTRRIADFLAESYPLVVVPKLLTPSFEGGTHGDGLPPDFNIEGPRAPEAFGWLGSLKWDDNICPKMKAVFDYLDSKGFANIGMVGFCWGGWVVCKCASLSDKIRVAVVPHPSIQIEGGLMGGDNVALASQVHFPILLLPAGNDGAEYRDGGELLEVFKRNHAASASEDYPDMRHGWASRGDMSDDAVRRDATKAINRVQAFLSEHL
mmetsp:Transcript_25470/g.37570  ORF Transcript_25470/g.37570 Transcript_25470/m.37570 type:complete len:263 (-) Transcript_25470:118-906(-)|eukprot:CAMPEP_0185024912 /NCGR_PEP_ID=MMETSP1103-20130426/8076_1 /TAXON_ID=36769 /ORGANISM="Paraphysomonas bandaiensis, Strain Caron Lab Isolate" /LENGTH=262 /DNA_ID=CAMNT_0027558001 /DNA_START=44 /DNA_END=832 /DNA_ORIENTATION=-